MCTQCHSRVRPAALGPLGRLSLFFVLAFVLGDAPRAAAQVFEATGERALGMGGAFVAVADDATATYWNPAGLATGRTVDACLAHARTEAGQAGEAAGGGPVSAAAATSFCLAIPAFGFSFNTLHGSGGGGSIPPTAGAPADRQDLRPRGVGVSLLTTRQVGVTLVQSLLPGVAVGATLKYVRGTAGTGEAPATATRSALLDRAEGLGGRTTSAFDADIGAMLSAGAMRAGIVVRNLFAPGFDAAGGARLSLPRQVRVGLAMTPGQEALLHAAQDGWLLSLDADVTRTATPAGDRRMVAAGVERWLRGHRLGVRGGVRVNTLGAARPAAAAGISVGLTGAMALEAHAVRGGQDADRGWGVGARAGF